MAEKLKINDYDLSAITNEVNKWQSNGYFASYDVSTREEGIAILTLENCLSDASRFAFLVIHKFGKKGFLGMRSFWVIQLHSGDAPDRPYQKHGCVTGKILVQAISEAKLDIRHNFLSALDFEFAVSSLSGGK